MYDSLIGTGSRSLAGLEGPGGVRLHSPTLSTRMHPLTEYLRFEADLSPVIREVAILATAREMGSDYEWAKHVPEALRVGVPAGVIEAIRQRAQADAPPELSVVIDLVREAITGRRVSAETFVRAVDLFGPRDLVDLVSLIGQYASTAILLAVFDNQVDSSRARSTRLEP